LASKKLAYSVDGGIGTVIDGGEGGGGGGRRGGGWQSGSL